MSDNYRRERDANVGARLTYFVIGATVGAVVALLIAPKSGRDIPGRGHSWQAQSGNDRLPSAGGKGARYGDSGCLVRAGFAVHRFLQSDGTARERALHPRSSDGIRPCLEQ